jgi:hypothetical protein
MRKIPNANPLILSTGDNFSAIERDAKYPTCVAPGEVGDQ